MAKFDIFSEEGVCRMWTVRSPVEITNTRQFPYCLKSSENVKNRVLKLKRKNASRDLLEVHMIAHWGSDGSLFLPRFY